MVSFFDHQIDGLCTHEFDIGSRGVEVRVVGDDIAFFSGHAEQDALSRASLVVGDHVPITEAFLDGIFEVVEAFAAGVALVAFHDAGPLVRGHGASAGVGEQIDEDIVGGQQEEIVVRRFEELLALSSSGPANGFDALDAERFNDGFGHKKASSGDPKQTSLSYGGRRLRKCDLQHRGTCAQSYSYGTFRGRSEKPHFSRKDRARNGESDCSLLAIFTEKDCYRQSSRSRQRYPSR